MYSFNLDYLFNSLRNLFLNLFSTLSSVLSFVSDPENFRNSFKDLSFSIQNPFLAFLADILTILFFFLFVIFIYIFCSWLWLNLKDNFQTPEKKSLLRKEKGQALELNKGQEGKVKHVYTFDPKLKLTEEQKLAKIREIEEGFRKTDGEAEKVLPEKVLTEEKVLLSTNQKSIEIPNLPLDPAGLTEQEKDILQASLINLKESERKLQDWRARWQTIQHYLAGQEENLWRIAILEADNLLDEILSEKGYAGQTVGEKLKQANFKTIELAWEVHKTRNRIAHDGSKFILSERTARKTIAMFESILGEFKVLE